jgi:hypothetical protein
LKCAFTAGATAAAKPATGNASIHFFKVHPPFGIVVVGAF